MKKNQTTSNGATLLQIAFIVLKLCGVIEWSWWGVLSPLWIIGGIVVIITTIQIIIIRAGH